ncbi:DUF1295 domain-containing protein [Acholeplasma hippikon]|uniref:Predicted membrane protein n=1 Tax=Acholeplasma hippikon TaxID=264636 RepID=A0A449BJR4_9MOLU|nr:DUF1295 domain-containing protein [Acholeplasma hippikon]VEU82692.1 Predicted membrane protein [Acholeplasma hippikon]
MIAQVKKNNGLIDIAWGASFVVTAVSSMLLSGSIHVLKVILLIVIILWGMRLTIYLFKRNWKKEEDFRYQDMRKKWKTNIMLKAFFKVFVTQSIFSYIISLPIILMNLYSNKINTWYHGLILGLGILVFLIGFIFEVLADRQLRNFKKDPKNKGKILKTGVWNLSRHPNYFGEATLWWGIGIISVSSLTSIPFFGLVSPLIMTVLLRFVTGVPLLEKRYIGNLDFEAYKKETPIFVPFLKKR